MPSFDASDTTGTGMIDAGSSALRRAISPLGFGKHKEGDEDAVSFAALSGDSINTIIEGEIIPRLLLAHAAGESQTKHKRAKTSAKITDSAAERFARLPLQLEVTDLIDEVETFLDKGVSVEAIHLDLLAPTARRLGEMWEADECDFVDVTMGLWRLQEVMREVSNRIPARSATGRADAYRALFSPMPGDEHSFGALMMDEIFSRSGWDSTVMTGPLRRDLLDAVSREPYDLVGLTLSSDCTSANLKSIIRSMRSVSCNPHLSVLVGGQMINQNLAIVAEVGADGTGADARAALDVANALVQSAEVRAQMLR